MASPMQQMLAESPHDTTLDFLSFMGLDQPDLNGGGPGPSTSTYNSFKDRRNSTDDPSRGGSSRGRTRTRSSQTQRKHDDNRSLSSNRSEMDVDNRYNSVIPFGPSQIMGLQGIDSGNGNGNGNTDSLQFGLGSMLSDQSQSYDANQANLLQQQLEHIHMQSPMFDPTNPQSPYHPMAQMFMTSPMNPVAQMPNLPQINENESSERSDLEAVKKRWMAMNGAAGMLTPGPSGEVFPQTRTDKMSPMQLEMLARGELEYQPGYDMTPLLSPALSQQYSNSTYASPAAFNSNSNASNNNANGNNTYYQTKSPLEQLQEQQKQFQEQLAILQHQQKELQATAAAVAAASSSTASSNGSPYINAQPRSATTPGVSSHHSAGPSIGNTPSPSYFSPLTSPALEANNGRFPTRYGRYSLGQQQQQSQPHPLSALSSPALNPVGSSGGAQQTLSPALQPQADNEMSDPNYLQALVGLLDNQGLQQQFQPQQQSQIQSSPLVGPIGTGPNRQSLPAKTRPSPMMKPTHRSHKGASSTSGQFSVPTSPAIQRVVKSIVPGIGYLPPAAIQPNNNNGSNTSTPQFNNGAINGSTTSTPSPVDLTQMMPPPPVPEGGRRKSSTSSFTPMTPATLMNLGSSETQPRAKAASKGNMGSAAVITGAAPRPATARKASGSTITARKVNGASKLQPTAAGKRALAMRPSGVGVRSATKGAASAANLSLHDTVNGELRKTSHKAAEQKRRDSLKASFDELRLLLPPINTEALDPESGEPIPGSSAPRLLPKSSLVPDDNPNRGVSKVALLKFSNEYIVRLHDKVEKRDDYIDKLRDEVRRLREGGGDEVHGDGGEDLLDMDMLEGEEDDFADLEDEDEEEGQGESGEGAEDPSSIEDADEDMDPDEDFTLDEVKTKRKPSVKKSPALKPTSRRASTLSVKTK